MTASLGARRTWRGALLERLRDPRLLALGMTVGAGWIARIVTALAQFLAIRILSGLLGVDGYGAYAVITGLLGWFMLADLGFGSSLQNHISARRVAGEPIAGAIRATICLLLLTTIAAWAVLIAGSLWAAPVLLDHFPAIGHGEAIVALGAFAMIATGTGATAIASRIFFAEQRGYIAHALSAGGAIVGLLALLVVQKAGVAHGLAWAIVAYNAPTWLLPAAALAYRVWRDRHEPRTADDAHVVGLLWRQARMFLLFNALAALVLSVDYVILSQTVPSRQIAIYAIYAKIYALIFFVYNSVLQAYWPVSAEAIHRGEYHHLRRLIVRAIGFGVAIVVSASLGFYLFLDRIGHLLMPADPLSLPAALIPLFAIYWLVRVWCDTFGMLIMSAGKPLFLCLMIPFQAGLNLTLGYGGARYFGLPGLLIGMTASFVLTGAWAAPLYLRHLARHSTNKPDGALRRAPA